MQTCLDLLNAEAHILYKGVVINWFRYVQRPRVPQAVFIPSCSKCDMTDAGSLPSFLTQAPKKENKKHAAITVTSWLSSLYANPRLALGSPKCNDDSLTLSPFGDRKKAVCVFISGCVGGCHAKGI